MISASCCERSGKMRRLIRCFAILIIILVVITALLMWKYTDNTSLQLTTYQVTHNEIPVQFNGFRIAMVSDLHSAVFGEENADLLSLLSESKPDIIVFTGDQLDARNPDMETVLDFVRQAVRIAPCYLVTGNHEGSIPGMWRFHNSLKVAGAVVLNDEVTTLSHNGATIDLFGLTDATMNKRYISDGSKVALETSLQELSPDEDRYSILLAHRPEYFFVYERNGIDLALCGHVHGGQIRILNRGIIGPGKEFFPRYDSGLYTIYESTMVLSRGLGNSIFPWRINNPPEIVIVELNSEA